MELHFSDVRRDAIKYHSFFDLIDDIDFAIDMFAGDKSEDASDTRKVMLAYENNNMERIYTVRSLTRNKKKMNKFSKSIREGSEWVIENSMPDISPETASNFYDYFYNSNDIKLEKKYRLNPNFDLSNLTSTLNRARLEWLGIEGKTIEEIQNTINPYHDHPTIRNPQSHLNWDIKQGRVIKD